MEGFEGEAAGGGGGARGAPQDPNPTGNGKLQEQLLYILAYNCDVDLISHHWAQIS
jgi:hypothetical protein